MIELALLLPFLCFLLIGGADLARAYAAQLAVQNGARAGAESATLGYNLTQTEVIAHVQQEMNRTPGVDASTCTAPPSARCSIDFTQPTINSVKYFRVEVIYLWRTIVPWPMLPNSATFDRTTLFRQWP
jgi:hypothetical protein